MATVIDVSSNLGVYMLKGWVRLNMAATIISAQNAL